MAKKFYKVKDPISGFWHAPSTFDKPVVPLPLAIIQTSNGDKGIHTIASINDPSELNLQFGSTNGHKLPGLFANLKRRFKEAIVYYLVRGWLTDADLAEMGLERKLTQVGGLTFATRNTIHTVRRKVERSREKFRL